MTILEAIELANKNAGIPLGLFADIAEFNRFFESGKADQYPLNLTVPFTVNGKNVQGIRHAVVPLEGWILTQLKQAPEDVRSYQVERDYIEPMRRIAAKFLKELTKTDIIDPQAVASGIRDSIKYEYAFTNHLLFGVSYRIDLPIVQGCQ